MEEIRSAKKHFNQPFLELADDNTFLNHDWSREFLKQLTREDIHWFTETDISIADDPELCDLVAESGCRQLLIGLESPSQSDLNNIDPSNWKQRQSDHYLRAIDTLQSRGISVNGCFILGLDHHTPAIFEEVHKFVEQSGLAEVQFTVMTPFPSSPLHQRLKDEGRLLRERYWDRCTLFDVNYQPANMTVEELEEGLKWIFTNTYNETSTRTRQRSFISQRRGDSC